MTVYVQSLGCGVWNEVTYDYMIPKRVRTTSQKKSKKNNSREMEAILDGLPQPIKEKLGKCISSKELWVKLEKLYSVEQRTETSSPIFENESDDGESCSLKENKKSTTIYKEKFNKYEEKLFMEIVTLEYHSQMEGVVDLKEELMSSLEELKKLNEEQFFGRKFVKMLRRAEIKR